MTMKPVWWFHKNENLIAASGSNDQITPSTEYKLSQLPCIQGYNIKEFHICTSKYTVNKLNHDFLDNFNMKAKSYSDYILIRPSLISSTQNRHCSIHKPLYISKSFLSQSNFKNVYTQVKLLLKININRVALKLQWRNIHKAKEFIKHTITRTSIL